jgi:hypothetical protein
MIHHTKTPGDLGHRLGFTALVVLTYQLMMNRKAGR